MFARTLYEKAFDSLQIALLFEPEKRSKVTSKEEKKKREREREERLQSPRVEWQLFKNMARTIVQIWSVTRKTTRLTRSELLDVTRSGLNTTPTGPGNVFNGDAQHSAALAVGSQCELCF